MTAFSPIAVTGVGIVTSIGPTAAETFASLCAGRSGLKPLQRFAPSRFRARSAYEIEAERPGEDQQWRASALLSRAIAQALDASGASAAPNGSIPCFVGTGLGELRSVELWWRDGGRLDQERLGLGLTLREAAPSIGHVSVITNACAASLFALANGVDALQLREATRVIVGGVDILTESMFGLLDRVQMTPPDCVRPFDRERLGVLMGDGAAAVVLEPLEAARKRGADIFGVIRGVGLSCDAHHETAPDPRGMERAVRLALEQSDLGAERIGFVMAHGTGTALNDKAEFAALASVFGSRTETLPLTAIKSMTGHTSGASGLIGLIVALMSLSERRLPPTISHETFMLEDQSADIVTRTRKLPTSDCGLVNAFGFGGVNASVVVAGCA